MARPTVCRRLTPVLLTYNPSICLPSECVMAGACEPRSFDQWLGTVRWKLEEDGQLDSIHRRLEEHTTDDDRFNYILLQDPVRQQLDQLEITERRQGKCAEDSTSLRTQGNGFYQKGKYPEALAKYNESLALAPLETDDLHGSKELALALANRSAVLFQLNDFSLCLGDIALALENGYPENLQYKLFDRKAKCLAELGCHREACTCLEKSITLLQEANIDHKKKATWQKGLRQSLDKCSFMCSSNGSNSNSNNNSDNNNNSTRSESELRGGMRLSSKYLPKLSEVNPSFGSLSAACDVAYTKERGRHIVANRTIEPGETVAIEPPYAHILLPSHRQTHCHHCLSRVVVSFPCQSCAGAQFCSQACRHAAWATYHQYECRILPVLHDLNIDKFGRLALRIITKSGLEPLRQFVKQLRSDGDCEETQTELDSKGQPPVTQGYRAIYNLVTHSEDRQGEDLLGRALLALVLLKLLQDHSAFFVDPGDRGRSEAASSQMSSCADTQRLVGSLLLRHLQLLTCNAHEISEFGLKTGGVIASLPTGIGAGIYATQSLFNHSCDPDVTRTSYGTTLVSRTIKLMRKGEEMTDNYGAIFSILPKPERHALLQPQYFFRCSCEACEKDWPLCNDVMCYAPRYWRCDVCEDALPTDLTSDIVICLKCRATQSMRAKLDRLKKSGAAYLRAMESLIGGKVHEAIPGLVFHLRTMDQLVLRPWRDFVMCQEALKQCYSILGNCHESEA